MKGKWEKNIIWSYKQPKASWDFGVGDFKGGLVGWFFFYFFFLFESNGGMGLIG